MRTELSHSARRLPPQRHRVRALRPNKRRNDRVCHRVSNNEDTDPHTISNALLVLAMINKGKLYSYQNARFFKQTSQWRRKSWWCNLPAALILWHAGSDVMGCRRPTGGVFKYVSSDTSHAEAFPVATPRGRSSSSHEGEPKSRIGWNGEQISTRFLIGANNGKLWETDAGGKAKTCFI